MSVNFWLTPDEANDDPESGGLIIWPEPPPESWSFGEANLNTDAIRNHLGGGRFRAVPSNYDVWYASKRGVGQALPNDQHSPLDVLRVPYRANRCLIFQSRLFHQTDLIRFKAGYRNRRINVTLLFE